MDKNKLFLNSCLIILFALGMPTFFERIEFLCTYSLHQGHGIRAFHFLSLPKEFVIIQLCCLTFGFIILLGIWYLNKFAWYMFHVLFIPTLIGILILEYSRFNIYEQGVNLYYITIASFIAIVVVLMYIKRLAFDFQGLYTMKSLLIIFLGVVVFVTLALGYSYLLEQSLGS